MRGRTITFEQELVTETCCNCGILFAMTADLQRKLRDEKPGTTFYCPVGHGQHYTNQSEAQKLKEQLDAQRRRAERAEQAVAREADWRREAEERAEHERRRANGHKGYAAKLAKRTKAGLCPCCNRSFVNMARHMATQHPDFARPVDIDIAANKLPA